MATLKDLLPQIPKDELAILRDLNLKLDESKLTEATAKEAAQAVKEIVQNWKNWSKYTVAAMLLIPNIANALETYSPKTLDAIRTELPAETSTKIATPSPIAGEVISFNFGENFDSGKATLANEEDLNKGIKNIEEWVKGKNLKNFKIVITASESQVTNPKGFEKPKSLARARAEAIEKLVSNLGFGKIEIDTEVGPTAYKAGVDNPDDLKYKREQFVTVSIVVENSVCSMAPFTESGTQGTYEEYVSGKGELVLYTGTIPDRLVVLDNKGNVKQDSGYVATEETNSQSGYQEWKYVPIYVLKLTELRGDKAVMGSNAIVKKFDKYQDLENFMLKPGAKKTKSDTVEEALKQLEAMFKGGTKEFVIYEVGTGDRKVPFDDSKGDVKAKVYSPVGKTGFKITGLCNKP